MQETPPPVKKRRVVCLIDGFNLFHAIDDCPHFHEYKWLNPKALAQAFIMPSEETLAATFFFTAVPTWNDKKRVRHEKILEIYEDIGVIVRRGSFKPTTAECRLCGKEYPTHEEKQTDINICLELLRMGRDDLAERVVLITGDNDQSASVAHFLDLYKEREVIVVTPPFRRAKELESVATSKRSMIGGHLKKSLLPNPYQFRNSKRTFNKPDHWVNAAEPIVQGWQPREQWVHKCEWEAGK